MCKDERANGSRLVVGWHQNEWLPLAGSAHAKLLLRLMAMRQKVLQRCQDSPILSKGTRRDFQWRTWPVNGRWGANNNGPPPKPEGPPKISESRLENNVWGAKFGGCIFNPIVSKPACLILASRACTARLFNRNWARNSHQTKFILKHFHSSLIFNFVHESCLQ